MKFMHFLMPFYFSFLGSCAQTVRIEPKMVATICPEPCQKFPLKVYGMNWHHLKLEKNNTATETFRQEAVDLNALRDPAVDCLEFVRPTTGRFLDGGLVGCGLGLIAGAIFGYNQRDDDMIDPVVPIVTPDVLLSAMFGCLAGFPVGGFVNHYLAGPDDYPANRCDESQSSTTEQAIYRRPSDL